VLIVWRKIASVLYKKIDYENSLGSFFENKACYLPVI